MRPIRSPAERRQAVAAGAWAETAAAWWLRAKGYRILARDFRCPRGQIDIVARRGDVLVVVEVKRRASDGQAAEALQAQQRQRIAKAAAWFVARHPAARGLGLRFDAVLLSPGRLPRHVADAWRP
jgi:putative endonuclease